MKPITEDLINQATLCKMIFEALQEIVGYPGVQAILNMTPLPIKFDPANKIFAEQLSAQEWQNLFQTLQSLFGVRGAQGIAVRTGQVFFRDYFRSYGTTTGMMDQDFRMLAKPKRIQRGLEVMAATFNKYVPKMEVVVIQDSENWFWRFKYLEWKILPTTVIILKFIVGTIQEFLSWTSGGKFFPVREMSLAAEANAGPIIVIQKKYLD